MPAIPQYVARNTPQGSLGVRSVDTGAEQIARGIGAFGAGLRDVSVGQFALQDANQEKIERDALVAADRDFAVFQEQQQTKAKQRQLAAPLDVKDFTPGVLKDYDKDLAEVLSRHTQPRAAELFKGRGMVLRERLAGDSTLFEAEQGIRGRAAAVVTALGSRELQIRNDPTKYPELASQQRAIIEAAGLPADMARKLMADTTERFAVAAVTNLATTDPMSTLRLLHTAPGKSGNAAVEALTPDGRESLIDFSRAEFSRLVTARAQQDAMAERAERERHEEGSRQLTLRLLEGKLTQSDLQQAVKGDRVDPGEARTLAAAMKNGDVATDPEALFHAQADLPSMSREEIANLAGVSWKDRTALLNDWQQLDKSWADSNEFQQGKSRIDNALGIVPGTIMAALSTEDKTRRARAQKDFWDQMSALPLAERRAKAVEVSDQIIGKVITADNQKRATLLKAKLAALKPAKNAAGQAEYERQKAALEKRIAEAEAQ